MRKFLIVIFIGLNSLLSNIHAENEGESVSPTYDIEFDRPVMRATIEGETYFNVIVEINAAEAGDILGSGVKITVKDEKTGKKIYKKRFHKSYLYAFSDGTIQIGKGNALTQLYLYKDNSVWLMAIREKGLY